MTGAIAHDDDAPTRGRSGPFDHLPKLLVVGLPGGLAEVAAPRLIEGCHQQSGQRPGTAPRALPCFLSMTERREQIARWIQAPSPPAKLASLPSKAPGLECQVNAVDSGLCFDEVLQQGAGSPVMLVLLRASLYQSCAPQYRNANPLTRASDSPDNIITYQFKS